MIKNVGLILCFVTLLFACEKEETGEIDQDKVYSSYELYYDGDLNLTTAKATFRNTSEEGNKLKLSEPSSVTFEGKTLVYDQNQEMYLSTFTGEVLEGRFVYTTTDLDVYTNMIEINSIAFPDQLDTVFRDQDYVFTWIGDSVGIDQSIVFNFNDYFSGNISLFIEKEIGARNITIGTDDLKELKAVPSPCLLERTYRPTLSEGSSVMGDIVGRYRAKQQIFVIK